MSTGQHVLIVDDDKEIRDLLARFLRKHGYRTSGVRDGREMRETLAHAAVDLVVLDLLLPHESGLDLCRELRARSGIPIIMLTAVSEATDRTIGLEMGADDYIAKPFDAHELLARIRAVLRRVSQGPVVPAGAKQRLGFSGWTLDLVRRELLSPAGVVVDLSPGEYDLLLAFLEHPQRVLNRDQLLDFARSRTASPFDRSIDVQVSRLRRKIDSGDAPPLIKTVRGAGYIFTASVERL